MYYIPTMVVSVPIANVPHFPTLIGGHYCQHKLATSDANFEPPSPTQQATPDTHPDPSLVLVNTLLTVKT